MKDKNLPETSKKNNGLTEELLDWAETLVLYCFIALLIFTFVLKLVVVDGPSMMPTLQDKDKLIVSNLFYTPKQGDIIIFNNDNSSLEKVLVKRVIATSGQTLSIDFNVGLVYVDGKPLDEPYINNSTTVAEDYHKFYSKYMDGDGNITVPEGYVFVMGDNRQNSTDSRSSRVGFVSVDSIIGKALFRLYPFTFF